MPRSAPSPRPIQRSRLVGGLAVVLLALVLWGLAQDQAPAEAVPYTAVVDPIDGHQACVVAEGSDGPSPAVRAVIDAIDADDRSSAGRPRPLHTLRCPLPPEVAERAGTGTARLDRVDGSLFEVATIVDGAAVVPDHGGVRTGTLYLDGFSPADLHIDGGVCRVSPPIARAELSGTVGPLRPGDAARVAVQGCGGHTPVEEDGAFFLYIEPGPCTVFAVRTDGDHPVRSDPVSLDLAPGEDVVVTLRLPTWTVATPGAFLGRGPDVPTMLDRVDPAGPAYAAGLRDGDRVTAVDGQAVDDLSPWEALDLLQGPPGSTATFQIERDGIPQTITVPRR